MISAIEALQLPSATLNEDELAAANMLEAEIEAHVRKFMQRRGPEQFTTKELRGNVVSEVNQRLKAAGWSPVWLQISEQSRVTGQVAIIAYKLDCPPSDASFAAHRKLTSQ